MNPPPLPSGASPDGSSQRLRVAHVVHGFGIGGLERSVAQLVEHLDRERYEHSVFCFGEVGPGRWWIRPGRAELVPLAKRKGNDPLLVRRLAKRLRASAVEVVHSHNWGTRVEAAVASRWVGAAHVHSLHGAPTEGVDCTPWRSRMRA
ncbi:MAG: glycosyltransferase, partial [Acidobacteriota bacterium]